ncbi:MAG TPA: SPOR domain-containing protein [Lysobacter sp.]|nr:SPOR domain-containing protein [Lysobacter sp.]
MLTRALIVLLIVLNLGVAAWWALRPSPRVAADTTLAGIPKLQLASERKSPLPAIPTVAPATPATTTAPASVEIAKQDAAPQCFRFGPFADMPSADAAAAKLRGSVRKSTTRTTSSGGKGWTVWLPPFADMTTAQAKALEIAGAGIKDYYVVAEGAQANAIMLGRYGSEDNAQRRIVELQAKGIQARVLPPQDAVSQAWVDVEAATGFAPAAAQARIGAKSTQPLDCAAR